MTAVALESPAVEARSGRLSRLARAALRFVRQQLLVNVVALVVGGLVWQLIAVVVDAPWLPTCWAVITHTRDLLDDPALRSAFGESVGDVLLGYGISVLLGLIIGVGMGISQYVDWALRVYLELLLFVPPIVTAPIFLVIFGLSKTTLLAVIVVFSATVIAVNAKAAVEGVDESLREVSRVFGAGPLRRIALVDLRAALPLIFTGLSLGVGRAVKGMIIGELFIAVIGLGAFEARFEQAFDAEGIWSIALLVVVSSLVLSWVVQFIDGLVNHWAYGGSS